MNAQPNQDQIDAQLEEMIDAAYEFMIAATTDAEAGEYCREMGRLIGQRSLAQVHRMERERRLNIRGAKG